MLPHELLYASAVHATSKRGTCYDCPAVTAVSQSVIKKASGTGTPFCIIWYQYRWNMKRCTIFGIPNTLVFSHQTWCDKSGLTPSSSTGCSVYRWNMKRWCTIFVVLYLTLTISGCAYAESEKIVIRFLFFFDFLLTVLISVNFLIPRSTLSWISVVCWSYITHSIPYRT